jgi:HlyD family type I secretion membrane fusion protein
MTKKKNKLPISNLDALKNVAKLAAPAVDESRKILKNISKTLHHKARNNEYLKDLINYLMAKTPEEAGYHAEIEKELKTAIKKPVKAGLYILGISLGLFVVWGGTAPLDSAAIAEATVMVAGSNKTIQHLEGGVVTKIIVKDGDAVKIGDELIKINDTHAKAQVHITKSQLDFATAVQARLKAEQNGDALIDWAVTSLDMNSSEARDIIKTQETLFESRRLSLNGRISVLSERIIQKQEEIKGLEAQQKSANSQYLTIEEQTNSYEDLNKKGLLTKTQYYEMQRAFDDITARKAQLAAAISAAKQEIAENQIQILNQETEYQQEVGKEYKENYAHLLESMDRHDAAQDVLERTIIKAPANGIVADLQYHTVGGGNFART